MKLIYLLPLLALTGCSATTPPETLVLRDDSSPLPAPANDIRNPEQTKAYAMGRYVDPNDPNAMHERHEIYRVEQNATFNTLGTYPPQNPAASLVAYGPTTTDLSPANQPHPVNPELETQVVQQQRLIAALLEETKVMSANVQKTDQKTKDLQQALQDVDAMKGQLAATQKELEEDKAAREKAAATPAQPVHDASTGWFGMGRTAPTVVPAGSPPTTASAPASTAAPADAVPVDN